jgi:hypothetical protein
MKYVVFLQKIDMQGRAKLKNMGVPLHQQTKPIFPRAKWSNARTLSQVPSKMKLKK